jgi:hypothetical protein
MDETTTSFPSPENENDPLSQGHSVDPTLQGDNEHTLETLDPTTRQKIDTYLANDIPQNTIKLEQGTTLEQQCESNYRYLEGKGISMGQYVNILQAAADECKRLADTGEGFSIARADGRTETVDYVYDLSGEIHPLTGEYIPSTANVFAVTPQDESSKREAVLAGWMGFSDLEIEMAQLGVFTQREGELDATCRADEILERLTATETGQDILQAQGIGQNGEA